MELLILAAAMVVAAEQSPPVDGGYQIPVVVRQMHVRHSDYRRECGLAPQRLDPGLCRLAQRLAEEMDRRGFMGHSTNLNYPECVCSGTDGPGSVEMWIGSGPHAAILLSGGPCVGFGTCGSYSASLHGAPYDGEDIAVSIGSVAGGGSVRQRLRVWRRR